jgi:hypothetical protein
MQRRNFLKSLGLAGAWFGTPALIANAANNTGVVEGELILKGKVQAGGKGIAGVAVTDGKSIVVTNKSGQYELKSHAEAEFVYISIPSGYAFPTKSGVAQFYTP